MPLLYLGLLQCHQYVRDVVLYLVENNWVSYIPLVLAILIMLMIALNFKDIRTLWALGIAGLGFLLVLGAHQLLIGPQYYHLGTGLLFFSILLNGSLFSLLRKFKDTNVLKFISPDILQGYKIF